MAGAKDIILKRIDAQSANAFVKMCHYSGKVVPNSQLHFGAFLHDQLHGVLSFGPSMAKKQSMVLVENTKWNEFIELNRMAFDNALPKNSESRCIAIALRLLKKHAPHIKWVLSFADGTQCGDGTIYRASGFLLTDIKKNTGMRVDENGNAHSRMTFTAHRPDKMQDFRKMKVLQGHMLRYVYLLDKTAKLTVPVLPYSEIEKRGARMYKGKAVNTTALPENV